MKLGLTADTQTLADRRPYAISTQQGFTAEGLVSCPDLDIADFVGESLNPGALDQLDPGLRPGSGDEAGKQIGAMDDAVGLAKTPLEFAAQANLLQDPSAAPVTDENGGRGEARRGD